MSKLKPCKKCGRTEGRQYAGVCESCRNVIKTGVTVRNGYKPSYEEIVRQRTLPPARSKTWIDVQIDELVTKITTLAKEQGRRRVELKLEIEISVKDAKVTQI